MKDVEHKLLAYHGPDVRVLVLGLFVSTLAYFVEITGEMNDYSD